MALLAVAPLSLLIGQQDGPMLAVMLAGIGSLILAGTCLFIAQVARQAGRATPPSLPPALLAGTPPRLRREAIAWLRRLGPREDPALPQAPAAPMPVPLQLEALRTLSELGQEEDFRRAITALASNDGTPISVRLEAARLVWKRSPQEAACHIDPVIDSLISLRTV